MKKTRINPMIKDAKKLKRINNSGSSDDNEVKSFIIIVVIITAIIGVIYGSSELLNKKNKQEEKEVVGKINYDRISIGTLLNRPYNEYYVIIYNSQDDKSILYSSLTSQYMAKKSQDGYIKLYYCDLENKINSDYYNVNEDNISNPKAKSISELDLGDLTLIKVKKGKIVNYYEDYEEIKSILK